MIDGNSTQGKGKEEKVFEVFASLKWVKHVYLWSRVINITCGSVSSGERVGVIGVAKGGGGGGKGGEGRRKEGKAISEVGRIRMRLKRKE